MITGRLPTPRKPGSLAPVARQAESLRRLGVDVDVLELTGPHVVRYALAALQLRRLVRQYDLVHAHFGMSGWVGLMQSRRPNVVSFMGDDLLGTIGANGRPTCFSRLAVRWNVRLAPRFDAVIVKSREMAGVVAPTTADVIPNGVDIRTFEPRDAEAARAALLWNDGRRRVLFAGSPSSPRKRFPLAEAACDAAGRLCGEALDVVPLWGHAPDRVATLMAAADALLLTSRHEGSPNVVKEAMACGLPVVSVPVGDVEELLEGVSPSVVVDAEPAALGAALARTLAVQRRSNGPSRIQKLGLDLDSVARRVLSVYERTLAARRG